MATIFYIFALIFVLKVVVLGIVLIYAHHVEKKWRRGGYINQQGRDAPI